MRLDCPACKHKNCFQLTNWKPATGLDQQLREFICNNPDCLHIEYMRFQRHQLPILRGLVAIEAIAIK